MAEPLLAAEAMRSGKLAIVVQHRDRAMAWMVAANLAKELGQELKDKPPARLRTLGRQSGSSCSRAEPDREFDPAVGGKGRAGVRG